MRNDNTRNRMGAICRCVTVAGLILANVVTAAAPALAKISTPAVTLSSAVISNNAIYDISFTTSTLLTHNGSITIALPSDTGVLDGNVTWNCTISASPGVITGVLAEAIVTGAQFTGNASARTIVIKLNSPGNQIGEGAEVRVIIGSGVIRNPSTTGPYTLNVFTSNETSPVTSIAYAITLPGFGSGPPGLVIGKNTVGQIVAQANTNNINTIIDVPGVTTVEVGAGTYNVTLSPKANQTIIAGRARAVILAPETPGLPAVSITADGVTLDGFTISPAITAGETAVVITGDNATIRNVTFNNGLHQLAAAENGTTGITIENCIFNITGNATIGLIAAGTTFVTNCVFNVDDGAAGIAARGNLTLASSRFFGAGSAGTGIYVTSGTSSVSNSTFDAMGNGVLSVSEGTLVVKDSTITRSGSINVSANTGIITANGGNLVLVNNTIKDSSSANYVLRVSGGNVTACFNSITGNTLNINQTGGRTNITHNWWGISTGPDGVGINDTSGNMTITPFLTGSTLLGKVAFNTSNLSAGKTTEVEVISINGTMGLVGTARYAANPLTAAPPGSPTAYYDVYADNITPSTEITVRFHAPVTSSTRVFYAGPGGNWTEATIQSVNDTAGFALIDVHSKSFPNINDLKDTVFAVTNLTPSSVATLAATSVTNSSAILNGNLTSIGNANTVYLSFQYGTNSSYDSITPPQIVTKTGPFRANITGLIPGTTYHFRARAVGDSGPVFFGSDLTFTFTIQATPPPAPYGLSPLNGTNGVPINTGFAWAQITNAVYDFQLSSDSIFANLTANASGLTDSTFGLTTPLATNTTYFWRVRAAIDNITGPWATATFTTAPPAIPPVIVGPGTPPQQPFVQTFGASVSGNSATIEGVVISLGTPVTVNVSFEYGTSTAYGSTTAPQIMTAPGTFSSNITVLPGTTYHYRAKVEGGYFGPAYGFDRTFTPSPNATPQIAVNVTLPGRVNSTAINVTPPPPSNTTANMTPPPIVNSTQITVTPPPSNAAASPNTAGGNKSPASQSAWFSWLLVVVSMFVIFISIIFLVKSIRH